MSIIGTTHLSVHARNDEDDTNDKAIIQFS